MRRSTLVGAAVTAAIMLSACSAEPVHAPWSIEQAGVAPASDVESLDADDYARSLAAAVAVQNGESFDSEVEVVEHVPSAPTEGVATATLAAYVRLKDDDADIPGDAEAFADSLEPVAEETYDEQSESLEAANTALDDANLSVSLTRVAVDDVTVSPAGVGTSEVVVDLYIARELSSGVLWEEVVPYVSTIEQSTGDVISFEVHDDAWVLDHSAPTEASTPAPAQEPSVVPGVSTGAIGGTDFEISTALAESASSPTIQLASLTATQRTAVGAYADRYWSSYNPAYLVSPQDCTNFASQALFAGGWTKVLGFYTLDSAWWYTGANPPKSYPWASAQNFFNFARGSGRSTVLPLIYSLKVGNILQYDIGAAGMNHTMIVTQVINTQPYLTYHTSNVHNKPFSVILPIIMGEDPTPLWYALTT